MYLSFFQESNVKLIQKQNRENQTVNKRDVFVRRDYLHQPGSLFNYSWSWNGGAINM